MTERAGDVTEMFELRHLRQALLTLQPPERIGFREVEA